MDVDLYKCGGSRGEVRGQEQYNWESEKDYMILLEYSGIFWGTSYVHGENVLS